MPTNNGPYADNHQVAPYPFELQELVDELVYEDGWRFDLAHIDRGQGSEGLTLAIRLRTTDSYHPDRQIQVVHYFPVPPAAYDRRSWQRWLLEQIMLVHRHEACENFRLRPDPNHDHYDRPYAPSHGPGNDPYLIREIGTVEDVQTSFRGDRTI